MTRPDAASGVHQKSGSPQTAHNKAHANHPGIRVRFSIVLWLSITAGISFGDYFFHVRNNTLVYYWKPLLNDQSVWAFPIFAGCSQFIILFAWLLPAKWLGNRKSGVRWPAFLTSCAVVYFIYFMSGQVGTTYPWTLTWIAIGSWALRLILAADSHMAIFVSSLALGIGGLFIEGTFSALGLFDYNHVDFYRCPLWLAGIYLHGGFALVEIAPGIRSSHLKLS